MKALYAAASAALILAASPPAASDEAELLWRECAACHALEPGRNTPAGPTLHRIVGRPVAAMPGFNYSPALRRFALRNPIWTPELLDAYLADPERLVPGTEMGFPGLQGEARRAALIGWLTGRAGGD